MPTCSFCRRRYKEPRGLTIFTFDGRSIHYCSSKCRKNMEHLGRDPKKTNWAKKSPWFAKTVGVEEVTEAPVNHSEDKTEEKKEEKKPEVKKK